MGEKITRVEKRYSPSPDAYTINLYKVGMNSSKWGFGNEKRGQKKMSGCSPGPGTYTHSSKAFSYDKPKFHMGVKLTPLRGNEKPGAGTYNPNMSYTKYNNPSFSVG